MDPFEVRMQFLSHLRKLNATQQSIQKVVGFAVRYFPGCGEDLWDCIVEECSKARTLLSPAPPLSPSLQTAACGSLNSRINILYFLDSLCETCLLLKSHSTSSTASSQPQYVDFVSRDLRKVVDSVVPEGRSGLPNLTSTKQILDNWRSKRIIDPQKVDDVVASLDGRCARVDLDLTSSTNPGTSNTITTSAELTSLSTTSTPSATMHHQHQQPQQHPPHRTSVRSTHTHAHAHTHLSRPEIQKRIEEDRERHKRLRERRWVQPISLKPASVSYLNPQLLTLLPDTTTEGGGGGEELPVDIEFDNEWETTSDWNEDDVDAAAEEVGLMMAGVGDDVP